MTAKSYGPVILNPSWYRALKVDLNEHDVGNHGGHTVPASSVFKADPSPDF